MKNGLKIYRKESLSDDFKNKEKLRTVVQTPIFLSTQLTLLKNNGLVFVGKHSSLKM